MRLHASGQPLADRFELSSSDPIDPLPVETTIGALHALRDEYRVVHDQNPEAILGMVVFGSMVKGKARVGSDVDAYVLYDPDTTPNNEAQRVVAVINTRAEARFEHLEHSGDNISAAVQPAPYCLRALRQELQRLEGLQRPASRITRVDLTVPRFTAEPFMLRVGPGRLQALRATILDSMLEQPYGVYTWRHMARTIAWFEEKNRKASIKLPDTPSEALDYFGIGSRTSRLDIAKRDS